MEAAKEYETLLEVNNNSLKPNGIRSGSTEIIREIMRECVRMDMPFILGSDAHIAFDLGNFKYAEELIAQLDIPEHLIVNRSVKFLKEFLELD